MHLVCPESISNVSGATRLVYVSPSAIPQVQCEVSHELDMAVLYVNGSAETPYILGDIVAEDD